MSAMSSLNLNLKRFFLNLSCIGKITWFFLQRRPTWLPSGNKNSRKSSYTDFTTYEKIMKFAFYIEMTKN